MPLLEELLARVVADPDDVGAKLVYADALMEAGDPHGELIALQVHEIGSDRELAAREAFEDGLTLEDLTWRDGFITHAEVMGEPFDLAPPAARLLRSLSFEPDSPAGLEQLTGSALPHLRELAIELFEFVPSPYQMSRALATHPRIESLKIESWERDVALPDLAILPELSTLLLDGLPWPGQDLPSLQTLLIDTVEEELPTLTSILDGGICRSLSGLGLFTTDDAAAIVEAFATSAIAGRLSAVGVTLQHGDATAAIARHRDFFGRVDFIDPPNELPYHLILELEARAELFAEVFDRFDDAIAAVERAFALAPEAERQHVRMPGAGARPARLRARLGEMLDILRFRY